MKNNMKKKIIFILIALSILFAGCAGKKLINEVSHITEEKYPYSDFVVLKDYGKLEFSVEKEVLVKVKGGSSYQGVLLNQDKESVKVYANHNKIILNKDDILSIKKMDTEVPVATYSYLYRAKAITDNASGFAINSIGYRYMEDVYDLEARTITPDGKIYEIDDDDIIEGDIPSGTIFYSSYRAKVYPVPGMQKGSIIELSYKSKRADVRFLDNWFFQGGESTLDSQLEIIAPKEFELDYLLVGTNKDKVKITEEEKGGNVIKTFQTDDTFPEFTPEQYMPSVFEIITHLRIRVVSWKNEKILSNWNDVAVWYRNLIQDRDKLSKEMRDTLYGIVNEDDSREEKIRKVYNYVQSNIIYVAVADEIGGYQPYDAIFTYEHGWGDCKDMANLIVAFLQELEIEAYSALVPTSDYRPLVKEFPALDNFNHAIAVVPNNDSYYFLDATGGFVPFEEATGFIRGVDILVIKGNKAEIVSIPEVEGEKNVSRRTADIKIDENLNLICEVEEEKMGAKAIEYRGFYHFSSNEVKNNIIEEILNMFFLNFELIDGDFVNPNQFEEDLKFEYKFILKETAIVDGNRILFSPILFKERAFDFDMFLPGERKHDLVLFDPETINDTYTVEIPAGYEIVSIPKDKEIKLPFAYFKLDYEQEGNKITVNFVYKLSKERLTPEEYNQFKDFSNELLFEFKKRVIILNSNASLPESASN